MKVQAKGSYHVSPEALEAEEQLIKAAQKDPQAFEPLYKSYYSRIAAYVYHRVENKELAFEITAAVFYRALESLPRYQWRGLPFSAWLFRIAANELNQFYRKSKTQPVLSIDREGLGEIKADMTEDNSAETDRRLFAALDRLDEDELELVNMRFFEKRSFKEMSEIAEIGESACKMRLYRILEKLKKLLNDIK